MEQPRYYVEATKIARSGQVKWEPEIIYLRAGTVDEAIEEAKQLYVDEQTVDIYAKGDDHEPVATCIDIE